MSEQKFDWTIERTTPGGIFGFTLGTPKQTYRRSGGVSRKRLEYRVMLANQSRDGSYYRLVRARIVEVPRR